MAIRHGADSSVNEASTMRPETRRRPEKSSCGASEGGKVGSAGFGETGDAKDDKGLVGRFMGAIGGTEADESADAGLMDLTAAVCGRFLPFPTSTPIFLLLC